MKYKPTERDMEYLDKWTRRSAITHGISDERLIEICHAERNGRLLILPCNIGDKIYTVQRYKDGGGFITESTVSGVHLRDEFYRGSIPRKEYIVSRCNGYSKHIPIDHIGKRAFFSREEAKNALK